MAIGSADTIGGDSPPTFDLEVNNTPVSDGIRGLVIHTEFESVDGMADLLKLVLADPINAEGKRELSDAKIFLPGNEITLRYGYEGGEITPVGRGLIRKVRPFFPSDSVPTLEVVCYSRDVLMMDNAPEPLLERRGGSGKGKNDLIQSKAGRRFENDKYSDVIRAKAEDYGFIADVDETQDTAHEFIQKAKMTDYEFVKGLSNLTGYFFWVDYDFEQVAWVLHFKNPETYREPGDKLDLKWSQGDFSTLLSFEPTLVLSGSTTKLIVSTKDPLTGNTLEVKIEENNDASPELIDRTADGTEKIESEFKTGSEVKLFLNDFSFTLISDRRFRSEAELSAWAVQWFRRQRENFILYKGATIGIPSLNARQVHSMSGLGVAYSGDYGLNSVRHVFDPGSGYICEISGNKHIGDVPQQSPVKVNPPGGGG